MKDSAEESKAPAVLTELWTLLKGARAAFGQERVYRRAVGLILAELLTLGRHTVTQLIRTLGAINSDWAAFYRLFSRERFDEAGLGAQLLRETLVHVEETAPYVVTVDGVRVPRSGSQVAGSSWWPAPNTAYFRRGLARAQRFVEIAWLTPEQESYCRAIPLRWLPAVTAKSVPSSSAPRKEWEAGLHGLLWAREQLDAQGRETTQLVGVLDGSYDTRGIWSALPANSTLIVRCAKNRALYALPEVAPGPPKRGRPALYGDRQPAPRAWLRPRKQLQPLTVRIRGRDRELKVRVVGPVLVEGAPDCPLFLLVIGGRTWRQGRKQKYRQPAYYLVNALWNGDQWELPFPLATLLGWAWQRWECEVAHRELKSALRIGDKQCWSTHAALAAVQWGVWVYALYVLAGYRAWGITSGPRRQGTWYQHARRWSFSTLRQAFQAALWEYTDFHPLYARSLDKWLKKELWLTGLHNALADPAYI
jgi:hypothetical protein